MAAVLYTYIDGMEEKRAPHRSGHLDLLKSMSDEGSCLLGENHLYDWCESMMWLLNLRPAHPVWCQFW